jgi:drug/metabolite transporter (DMT)-like permease
MSNANQAISANSLAVLALLAGACCIALAPIMVKVSELGPQASAAWRLLLALPLLAVWASVEQRQPAPSEAKRTNWLPLIGLAGLWFGLDLITWHAGIVRTSAANATFLANLTPVLLVAGTWITTRKRPQLRLIAIVALALMGAFLMSGGAPGLNPEMINGDLLSALTAVWYALYFLTVAKLRDTLGAGTIMFGSTAVAACVALIAVKLSGEPFWPPMTPSGWAPLIVLGVVSHVTGQGLLAWALGRVEAAIAGIIILVQPVVAGLIGWVWLGEALGALQLAGGALVLVAVWQARQLKV